MKKLALIVTICILLASISVVQFNNVAYASPDYEYKKPTAFTDASPLDEWSNEANAYDSTDPNETATYALGVPTTDQDPSVTFSTWGTKGQTYTATDLFVNWKTNGGWGNDYFAIRYTKDGGTNWYDIVVLGLHNETTIQQPSVALDTNQDLTLVQVKVVFDMRGQPDAGAPEIHIYDIWTRGAYPTWESYSDPGHGTQCEIFDEYPSENTAYMYGTGFAATTTYKVIFWDFVDPNWVNRQTETPTSDGSGNLSAAHTFVDGTDTEGNWHCAVYTSGATPSTYDANDPDIVADDTSYTGVYAFYVYASAIPEFPTIMAGIAVAGLCFGIYWWMRKRRLVYVKA